MKKLFVIFAVIAAVFMSGCQRIETGETGLRINFNKTVDSTELQPGSLNQTIWGDVMVFPVKEIAIAIDNEHPQTSDNSALSDFDFTLIYSINPSAVSELYTTRSKSFNSQDKEGNPVLMYNYMKTVANSAAYKAVRKYQALTIADHRQDLEQDIINIVKAELANEKLDTSLIVTKVQIRSLTPNPSIIESANAVINAQNNLKEKNIEVEIAQKEAERLKALSSSPQSIEYMHAKALQDIAEGVKDGNVEAVVVPYDFKGIVNISGIQAKKQ